MDEVEIRTFNDISDAEIEMNFVTDATNECSQSCDIIKEEIEYENVSGLDDICGEYQDKELLEISDSESKPSTSSKSFSWDSKTTLLLLREYKLRLDKFRDPKYKKSDLWNEISNVFSSYGFDVHHAYLNKKFRNMKNTFVNIFFSNVDGRGNKPIKWDYYNIFLDLFKDDETFKSPISYEVLETNATIPLESLTDKELHLLPVKSISKVNRTDKPISFTWNQDKCMLLLNEYKSRLEEFRNPKKSKKELWTEIQLVFQSRGYDVDEETLYKKFRNMKQTYMSNLNSEKRVKWIYHTIFSEIFDDIPTTNVNVFTSEYESDTVNSSPDRTERLSYINEVSTDSFEGSKFFADKFESMSNYQSSMLEFQNKRYRLDVARTNELKKLRLAMEHSNTLQEKRNVLLEKLIDVIKQKNEDGEFF